MGTNDAAELVLTFARLPTACGKGALGEAYVRMRTETTPPTPVTKVRREKKVESGAGEWSKRQHFFGDWWQDGERRMRNDVRLGEDGEVVHIGYNFGAFPFASPLFLSRPRLVQFY